jgi:hypothetical protein
MRLTTALIFSGFDQDGATSAKVGIFRSSGKKPVLQWNVCFKAEM